MEIKKAAFAGTTDSCDVLVEISPSNSGLEITLESTVEAQFGEAILDTVRAILRENNIDRAALHIQDHGAFDCVLRARLEAAILRGRGAF